MRQTRPSAGIQTIALLLLLALAGSSRAQNAKILEQFKAGPHVAPARAAVVGVEVKLTAEDGAAEQLERASGLLIRCDGYVLVPASLFTTKIEVAGSRETARVREVWVTTNPGSSAMRRWKARSPVRIALNASYTIVRILDFHAPAARLMLPSALPGGTAVELVWTEWNSVEQRFSAPKRLAARLGKRGSKAGDDEIGSFPFETSVADFSDGAAVAGPGEFALGMITTVKSEASAFASTEALGRVTNAVMPATATEEAFTRLANEESEPVAAVPGGPVALSAAMRAEMPDLDGAMVACCAPFFADRFEVTNRNYLAYWRSLPEMEKRAFGFRAAFLPLTWAPAEPHFPEEIADLPVLGVSIRAASGYAAWRGKRLLTPVEWILAAFGPEGERQPPAWVQRYVGARQDAWTRLRTDHLEMLRRRPELRQEGIFHPLATRLPWVVKAPLFLDAAAWSKRRSDAIAEEIRSAWSDPHAVQSAGSREYDVSPFGLNDMLLNAFEIVAPPPTHRRLTPSYYIEPVWLEALPKDNEPWWVRDIDITTDGRPLQPVSRLHRRTRMSPKPAELLMWHRMNSTIRLLPPLAGMTLRIGSRLETAATTWAAGRSPYDLFGVPAGLKLWMEEDPVFRREMGRPVPINEFDPEISTTGGLFYYLPVGFRCAR